MPWSRLTLLRAHRVEAGLLLIIEQIVEPGERRTHALRRNEHRLETLCHRVEPPNRCQRRVRWAGVPQVLGRFRGGVPEFVQGLDLPLIGADLLIDPANRLLKDLKKQSLSNQAASQNAIGKLLGSPHTAILPPYALVPPEAGRPRLGEGAVASLLGFPAPLAQRSGDGASCHRARAGD